LRNRHPSVCVDQKKVRAPFENGVPSITLQKTEEARSVGKKIPSSRIDDGRLFRSS
jgi:hypothetical protein